MRRRRRPGSLVTALTMWFALLASSHVAPAQELCATRTGDKTVHLSMTGARDDSLLVIVRTSEHVAAELGVRRPLDDLLHAMGDDKGALEAIGRGRLEHDLTVSAGGTAGVAGFTMEGGTVGFVTSLIVRPIGNMIQPGVQPHEPPPPRWGAGTSMPIGVNVDIPGRGDTSFPFKDLMIQADFWQYVDVGADAGRLVPESTAQVPTYPYYGTELWQMPKRVDFAAPYGECAAILTVVKQADVPSGTYVITWDGAHATDPGASAVEMGYLAGGGPVTGVFTPFTTFTQVSPNRIELTLRNADEPLGPGEVTYPGSLVLKVASSSQTDPVRNVRVWLPGMEDAAPTDMITPWMVASCRPARCIRFLNWVQHVNKPGPYNQTPQAVEPWSLRNLPGTPFQTRRDRIAVEHMAELSRKARADAWMCFTLGVLAENGSTYRGRDRVIETMRVFDEQLHAGGRVYVELGNELWNTGLFTVQNEQIQRLRDGSVRLDGSPGPEWSDTDPLVQNFGSYRAMVRCMSILWAWCAEALGDETFAQRVVRVYAGRINGYGTMISGSRATDGITDVTPADWMPTVPVAAGYVAGGRVMIDDIDAFAAGGYMPVHGQHVVPGTGQTLQAMGGSATEQHVLETMQASRLNRVTFDDQWKDGAAFWGKPYLNYEAGQHVVDNNEGWRFANNLAQTGGGATSPLSMEGEYLANLDQLWQPSTTQGSPGVRLSVHYSLRSRQTSFPSGTWGLGNDFQSTHDESPKLRALRDWAP